MNAAETPAPFVEVPDLTEGQRAQLTRAWKAPKGFIGWLKDTHHTSIGKRYIVTAFMFFAFGGIEALIMRLQLSKPDNHLVGPDLYNQLFTVHGTTMMFLFAVPVMQGLGLYAVPLMIGARNSAFPRLAAFSYWAYLFGGLFLYVMFLINTGPDAGWFAYVPLSGPQFSPGKRVDTWAQMITFTEIAGLAGAVNLVVTILKFRAPGMSLSRMPLFAWSQLVMNLMVIFGLPAIVLCSMQLALDRLVGTHFFNPGAGGDALLWQHLFWFFGHPEVYIIFVPGLGIMDTLLIAFCRREVVGYIALVSSLIATGFLAFGLWVHHMFATGLPQIGASFFTAASILISLPTAVQVYCWLAMLWRSRPRMSVPLAFALSFFVVFVLGGMTGVMLGSVPIDLQVHDTFFVVAHLHYVLLGGSVMFPLFGAIYYWYPKMTGKQLSQKLGWLNWA
ncbi:MAG: cbb3-type cytochrome c oxidase subunit I, partial [Myxococcaceae bacterium]